ncbi:GNAT family N-acetyltransferase [Desulfobacula toluolica]|uniref:Putative acetyltransferase, GNAT family n=1 Tax=Desulfobacula toluolica (strain DSM 7467 / Tol2) TaxID=651182 RepID=K0NIH8_DESTT|nr:GNAT family N-acetyltransferase [Desulfobacula toluolica]CCK81211.1 putative acetyltransferase, GNAT family [Desulfobacula toluolica Tol2]
MSKSILHKIDGKNWPLEIRWSTDEDMPRIHEWLQEEKSQGVHGNFLCNWNLTKQCHQEGNLLVLLDKMEGIPIGYQWGQLLQSGILQIRNSWRGKGLGRLVVEHCIDLALEQDEMVLQIECKPLSSIPFWKSMGFTVVEGEYGRNAQGYRVLTKPLQLPSEGVNTTVRISIFPEDRKWSDDVSPIDSFSPRSMQSTDGQVHLAERVAFSFHLHEGSRDPVIEILINGKVLYRDKAKYQEAQDRGVRLCLNGFFIDQVKI